jgi:hypothetical protein
MMVAEVFRVQEEGTAVPMTTTEDQDGGTMTARAVADEALVDDGCG